MDSTTSYPEFPDRLSESTERHDRGKKFQYYRSIDSVQEYVLVAQDTQHIDYYRRQSDNLWLLTPIDMADERLDLLAIDCTLTIADIYEKVPFEEVATPSLEDD